MNMNLRYHKTKEYVHIRDKLIYFNHKIRHDDIENGEILGPKCTKQEEEHEVYRREFLAMLEDALSLGGEQYDLEWLGEV